MTYKLKEKCDNSRKREFFYGNKENRKIKDVYLGLCYLEPNESGRKAGPGKGHEEILYLLSGKIQIESKEKKILLTEGEEYFIPDGYSISLKNLTENRIYFIIAGGHPKPHKH
ncbi:MAG: cupin domain-containing protein [Candidatus Hodarchaeota archaeon]